MKNQEVDRTGFFSVELFAKIKEYLWTAKKDDPPVIGTTENFCQADPPKEKRVLGMVVKANKPVKKELSMEETLSGAHVPGAADLVNKLIEEESHDE